MRFAITIIIFFAVLPTYLQAQVEWEEKSPGLEVLNYEVPRYVLFSSRLILFRIDLKNFQVGVVQASDLGVSIATIKNLVQRTKATLGVNANFFDHEHAPLGLVMSRGLVKHQLHMGGNLLKGIFANHKKGVGIFLRDKFSIAGVKDAIQGGPVLLQAGIPTEINKQDYDNRSGVCIDKNNKLIIFVTNSSPFGITLKMLQEILISIGCKDALNLDGGNSSQLYVSMETKTKEFFEVDVSGGDEIPVGLLIFPRS